MWHIPLFAYMRCGLLSFLLVHSAIASPNPLQVEQPLCDKNMFGKPNIQDCYQALFWIPYANAPARDSPDAKAKRLFAEPQYLDPPFKAVKNPYAPKAIVQLPKIWKYGSCQIALVTQPYDKPYQKSYVKAEFTEKWSDIVNQVLRLRPCLQPKKGLDQTPQGGYTPLIVTQSRPAGLYMYTTDSLFNAQMSNYMASGKVITPPKIPRLLGNLSGHGTFPSLSLNLFNTWRDNSSTPMLDLLQES